VVGGCGQVFASVILAVTIISVSLTVWDERRNINRIQKLINQYARPLLPFFIILFIFIYLNILLSIYYQKRFVKGK
jgi:hypothetical protein